MSLSLVSVVCCQVKTSASGLSLVQRSSTEFGVLSVTVNLTRTVAPGEWGCAFVGYSVYL
jgi:hypothetical protein